MDVQEALNNAAVIGAGGKMGSGIAYLLLRNQLRSSSKGILYFIDPSPASIDGLKRYLEKMLEKDFSEIYGAHGGVILETMTSIEFSTDVASASMSPLVFEAVPENLKMKTDIFSPLRQICPKNTLFLTNTSSIPISILEKETRLKGRIVGFHFYNPPAIQKLLEIILTDNTSEETALFCEEIGTTLEKTLIFSKDVAGFIGNGHFLREVMYTCNKTDELAKEHGLPMAITLMNVLTKTFLLRPMGMFQLMDYVGLETCHHIGKVMETYIPGEAFQSSLIKELIEQNVRGGQYFDGSQKPGFFNYENHRITKVYDSTTKSYEEIQDLEAESLLGELPASYAPWKELIRRPECIQICESHFRWLFGENTLGSKLAREFLTHSREIGEKLLRDGIASSAMDLNTVLTQGFYHLYGPINKFLPTTPSPKKS